MREQVQLVKRGVLAGITWLVSRPFCDALCSERERSWDGLNPASKENIKTKLPVSHKQTLSSHSQPSFKNI